MLRVMLDTSVWLAFIDRDESAADAQALFNLRTQGVLEICASSRTVYDTERMHEEQRLALSKLLEDESIAAPAQMRWDVSRLDAGDYLGPSNGVRTEAEIAKFDRLVGRDPVALPQTAVGNRLPNKIGDYDALREHFIRGLDAFLTLDARDILHSERRARYRTELGLVIQAPGEFLAERFPGDQQKPRPPHT